MSHEAPKTGGFAAEVAADMQVKILNPAPRLYLATREIRCHFVAVWLLSRWLCGVVAVALVLTSVPLVKLCSVLVKRVTWCFSGSHFW